MATDTAAPARQGIRREILALQVVVLAFLALRLWFDLSADLFGDEAYYWMWGQRPGWSYFDHPPLHAWLLGAVSTVTGWHAPAVRLLTWLSLGAVLAIFTDWSKRLGSDDPERWFWRTAAAYLASPLFFGMTMIAYNDHLLVALCLLAIHCFVRCVEAAETGGQWRRWLFAAAVALGLAALTKYNAVFVGMGFAATFLLRPKLRPLLRTPWPWLAALIATAMQAPVIWWNLTTGLASFRYHLDDRWGGAIGQINWLHPVNFLLLSTAIWSPFLIWPLIRMLRAAPAGAFEARLRTPAVAIFAISTACFVVVSPILDAYFYWNIIAFVGLMPLLTRFLANRWLLWSHIAFGLLFAGLICVNFALSPIGPLLGLRDNGSSINYGWSEVAGHMQLARASKPADFVAATRYSTTSQLGFALGSTAVTKLSAEHSQWDYWQDPAALAGKSGLILADESDKSSAMAWLHNHFATLTQVDSFAITRFGRAIYSWRIFRGEGFIPDPSP